MHHTLGLHEGPNYFRLDKTYEVYRGRMPDSVISFADDPGGNAYCIAISGKDRGKVYFWDHEQEEISGDLRLLANSRNPWADKSTRRPAPRCSRGRWDLWRRLCRDRLACRG